MIAGIAERIGVCCSHPLLLSLLSLHRIRSAFSPPHLPYPEMHGGGSRFISMEPCLLWFFLCCHRLLFTSESSGFDFIIAFCIIAIAFVFAVFIYAMMVVLTKVAETIEYDERNQYVPFGGENDMDL